jgi:hypothetical protein
MDQRPATTRTDSWTTRHRERQQPDGHRSDGETQALTLGELAGGMMGKDQRRIPAQVLVGAAHRTRLRELRTNPPTVKDGLGA